MYSILRLMPACGLLSVGILFIVGCAGKPPAKSVTSAVPVKITTAKQQTIPEQIANIATAQPYRSVTVQSQVNGQVMAVKVQPGDEVKKGQVLFRINSDLYQAALLQAQANLIKDQATAQNDLISEQQEASLLKTHAASPLEYLTAKYTWQAAAAQVKADQAAVKTAQLNLNYCTITAPMDSRAGNLLAYVGTNVSATSTNLLVLNELKPIYVAFAIPQHYLVEVQAAWKKNPNLPIWVDISGAQGVTAKGRLSFIDNNVAAATGTVMLMGTFDNQRELIWPGELLNATLQVGEMKDAVTVPAGAVQVGQNNDYVYVVAPDNTVKMVTVKSGITYQGNTVITSGLKAGDVVVTDGQVRLEPGSHITVVKQGLVAPASTTTTSKK